MECVIAELKKNKKIASATHNILAYRSASALLHIYITMTVYILHLLPNMSYVYDQSSSYARVCTSYLHSIAIRRELSSVSMDK